MNDDKKKQLTAWLESMPWWDELPYAQLEADNEALREHFNAHLAVENGLASMDLHNEAVDRLTKARDALLEASK